MNDNDRAEPHSLWSGPDSHGHAAMLLIESLVHGLIEKQVLTAGDAVAIVERAGEVQSEIASDLGDTPDALRKSQTLLNAVAESLRLDTTESSQSPVVGSNIGD